MNDEEVHKATSEGAPLFYWMHLANGEQYLVPFICQRCGNCCRSVFSGNPCEYFGEPNVCVLYDYRPQECRTFPTYSGIGVVEVGCKGYQLSKKAISRLGQGIPYWTGYETSIAFKATTRLQKAIAKLERGNLPGDFVDRFLELNS